MKNADIGRIFSRIADILEIRQENPFRIRAYRRAAFSVENLGRDISAMKREEILSIPGIGDDLAAKIEEYCRSGHIAAFDELSRAVPESLVDLLGVPGVGPKTVAQLQKEFGVTDIDGLEQLARGHKLSHLPGIGEKTEANILRGIEMIRRQTARHPLGKVLPVAEEIVSHLAGEASVGRIEIAGSIRRRRETIKDIDIVATSRDPHALIAAFVRMKGLKEILSRGTTRTSVVIREGLQVDLRVVEHESFGAALAYFTGSKSHNIRLRERAVKMGMKVNEYGIYRESDGVRLGGTAEEDIYRALGLAYIPPELREDSGEVEAAQEGRLPALVSRDDIRGDLHVHTVASDGRQTLAEVAAEARAAGHRYIAITDHAKGLGVAHGLDERRIADQITAIAAFNRGLRGFRVLSGLEVNIGADGRLDIDDDLLSRLDIVVASVHSGFRQPAAAMTQRIITAMANPYVAVIGHPTGRLIGERDPYDVDMDSVIRAAAESGTALEINAYPLRLDLQDSYVRSACRAGAPLVVSTDSHTAGQSGTMRYGVWVARRGWAEKKNVLNTLPCDRLLKFLQKKRLRR